jgi:hypothetical protein
MEFPSLNGKYYPLPVKDQQLLASKYLNDLENNVFREGRPDDFISKTTNNDYSHFKESNPNYHKMIKFFEQILPDEAVRKYFLLNKIHN